MPTVAGVAVTKATPSHTGFTGADDSVSDIAAARAAGDVVKENTTGRILFLFTSGILHQVVLGIHAVARCLLTTNRGEGDGS